MTVELRKAELSDLTLLRGFEAQLVSHEQKGERTLKSGELQYYDIEALIKSSRALVLIAMMDGKAVGCGFGEIKDNDECYVEANYGYIGLMFVDEEARGNRVGEKIIGSIIEWFKERAIKEVRLKVYASNPSAVAAYQKYGFTDYIREMRREI